MDETAQIILAVGVALGIILFALKGNLAVVLGRSDRKAATPAEDRPIRRKWWLLAIVCVSALSGLFNLLSRLI